MLAGYDEQVAEDEGFLSEKSLWKNVLKTRLTFVITLFQCMSRQTMVTLTFQST